MSSKKLYDMRVEVKKIGSIGDYDLQNFIQIAFSNSSTHTMHLSGNAEMKFDINVIKGGFRTFNSAEGVNSHKHTIYVSDLTDEKSVGDLTLLLQHGVGGSDSLTIVGTEKEHPKRKIKTEQIIHLLSEHKNVTFVEVNSLQSQEEASGVLRNIAEKDILRQEQAKERSSSSVKEDDFSWNKKMGKEKTDKEKGDCCVLC